MSKHWFLSLENKSVTVNPRCISIIFVLFLLVPRNRNRICNSLLSSKVDFGPISKITGIATQGRYEANQWVKSYSLSYSRDGIKYIPIRKVRICEV